MGSIVAYDVLTQICPDIKIDTLITIGSPLGLPFVVSRIVTEQKKNTGKEATAKTPENIKHEWYNYADLNDSVALDYTLSDDYGKNSNGIGARDIQVQNDYEYLGNKNPHKSYGYLRTPELIETVYSFLNRGRWRFFVRLRERLLKYYYKFIKKDDSRID